MVSRCYRSSSCYNVYYIVCQAFFGFGERGVGFNLANRTFKEQFRCYSMVFSRKTSEEVTHGGKIIMPPSALEQLARLNISYPMLFKLTSGRSASTHCGVLEFVAEEGRIYVPHWVRAPLAAGASLTLSSLSLR